MDKLAKEFCFRHPAGEDIYLFTLRNNSSTVVSLTNYGAIIKDLIVPQQNGTPTDIVLGFDNVEDYLSPAYLNTYPYFGTVIGRYGNRIKDGQFSLDGQTFHLQKNNGPDHLHGGPVGFDKKVWKIISSTQHPHASVTLQKISPDGEEGYPGTLITTLQFTLTDQNELIYAFTAQTDQATIINLTHHSYFNLAGHGTSLNNELQIHADHILQQGRNHVPTGELLPVTGTIYDFRTPRTIDANWDAAAGYDQSFVINDRNINTPAATAWCAETGIRLDILTSEPVVHLYTGNGIPTLKGKKGIQYGPCSGFCLETQIHPNAINIPSFPDTVLRPGQTYHTSTIYRLSVDARK